MRKLILIPLIAILLSFTALAGFSTDRTSYYYHDGVYLTDGIQDDDCVNGDTAFNGKSISQGGWMGGVNTYTNAFYTYGNLSMQVTFAGGAVELDPSDNASFRGKVGIKMMVGAGDSYYSRITLNNDMVTTVDVEIGHGATWQCNFAPCNKYTFAFKQGQWVNITYNFTQDGYVSIYMNNGSEERLIHNITNNAGLSYVFLREASDVSAVYFDEFWVSNGNRPAQSFIANNSINIIAPLNNSTQKVNPLNFTYNFNNFNPTNCSMHHNLTGYYTQIYSVQVGNTNTTLCYNQTNMTTPIYNDSKTLGWYRLENNMLDSSIYLNNLSPVNTPSYTSSKNGNNTGNYSMQLATNQYGEEPSNTVYNFEYNSPFSISFWFKSNTKNAINTLVSKYDSTGLRGYSIYSINLGYLSFLLANSASHYAFVRIDTDYFTNAWYHIVMTYDGSNSASGIITYVNGFNTAHTILSDNLGTNTITTSQPFRIGRDSLSSSYYTGLIDEVAVFNYTLSQDNVTRIYNNGVFNLSQTLSNYTTCNTTISNNTLDQNTNISFIYSYPNMTVGWISYYMNCHDGVSVNSSYTSIFYTNDFYAPDISIITPSTTYNETYNTTVYINFTTGEYSNCILNDTRFSLSYTDHTFFSFIENIDTQGNFNSIMINCTDLSSNSAYRNVFYTKDISYPHIYIYSPINNSILSPGKSYFRLNLSLLDDRDLYDYTVNITYNDIDLDILNSVYSESGVIAGIKYYNISKMINSSNLPNNTLYSLQVRTCDSHTGAVIDSAKRIIETANKLSFSLKGADISIESLGGDELSADTEKLADRYTFSFRYAKDTPQKNYKLLSDVPLHYLENSEYPAHFVAKTSSDTGYWIDFEEEGASNYVDVNIISDYEADITLTPTEAIEPIKEEPSTIKFMSIGELNCIDSTTYFSRGNIPTNYAFGFSFSLNNTGNVLFFLALVILFIGTWVIAYWWHNFGFASMGFFVGIVIGLVLASIHIFFLLMFTFINVVLFIQFGRSKK